MDLHAAKSLALELMEKHGLIAQGWRFRWDRSKRYFGTCDHWQKLIVLSKPWATVESVEEVRDTILHEIAHALTIHDTGDDGHGPEWNIKGLEFGCRPRLRFWEPYKDEW